MADERSFEPVSVRILEKEYLVACPPDERDELLAAAKYLDHKMREIRDSGRVIGTDRIAVMAGLNLAHELLSHGTGKTPAAQTLAHRLRMLQERIEDALHNTRQLEL